MDERNKHSNELISCLDKLVENYRLLLDVVRAEKECLIRAELDRLQSVNQQKELLLYHLKQIDHGRSTIVSQLAAKWGCEPRLLAFAEYVEPEEKQQLLMRHQTLTDLTNQIQKLNQSNEVYASSALKGLRGALDEIKETLLGKKMYEKRGHYKANADSAGSFVSKEA